MLISVGMGIIITILSLAGMILFIGKTWYYIPVFVFHFLMIPFMADEGRRVLPFLPFYFMFLVLGIIYIINKIRVKLKKGAIITVDTFHNKPFLV
jgi:hypothetical protein